MICTVVKAFVWLKNRAELNKKKVRQGLFRQSLHAWDANQEDCVEDHGHQEDAKVHKSRSYNLIQEWCCHGASSGATHSRASRVLGTSTEVTPSAFCRSGMSSLRNIVNVSFFVINFGSGAYCKQICDDYMAAMIFPHPWTQSEPIRKPDRKTRARRGCKWFWLT